MTSYELVAALADVAGPAATKPTAAAIAAPTAAAEFRPRMRLDSPT
jgi:hypothetical protein